MSKKGSWQAFVLVGLCLTIIAGSNLDTSIKCGPYDRSRVRTMMVRYARWVDGTDPGDVGEFGVSFDGEDFTSCAGGA